MQQLENFSIEPMKPKENHTTSLLSPSLYRIVLHKHTWSSALSGSFQSILVYLPALCTAHLHSLYVHSFSTGWLFVQLENCSKIIIQKIHERICTHTHTLTRKLTHRNKKTRKWTERKYEEKNNKITNGDPIENSIKSICSNEILNKRCEIEFTPFSLIKSYLSSR